MLCWCLSFGRVLVKKTQDDSKKLLLNAFGKQPRYVWLYRDGAEVQIALDRLQPLDVIVVNTGEVVPVDGIIVQGMAMIDQHALTGESTPAEKGVGDRVFAATLMVAGKILVQVEKSGNETASAKISQILNDTAGYKLSSQHKGERLADKAVIPTLAVGAVGMAAMGPGGAVAVLNSDFGTGIRMAAPLGHALLAGALRQQRDPGQGRASARADERGRHRAVRQDRHADSRAAGGGPNHRQPWLCAGADPPVRSRGRAKVSSPDRPGDPAQGRGARTRAAGDRRHPVQGRLRHHGRGRRPHDPRRQQAIHGPGGCGDHPRSRGSAGTRPPAKDTRWSWCPSTAGWAGRSSCTPRSDPRSARSSKGLRDRGIKHIAIISGDHEAPTRKLAESLGMDRYFAQVLPADKADHVIALQKEGRKVCFVGDGINDSIALKQANVSISLRGASSIATDTAHIVFLEEGLSKLCDLRDIARDLDRNVRRSWRLILAPNIACIAGVFTLGFGIMASVITNNVAALAALANGMLPLRKIAQIEAEKRHEQELRQAYALEREAV